MANISYEVRQDLLTVVVGMFDGAPTKDLLTSLVDRLNDGATVAELADELGNTEELASIYPNYLTAEEFAASFVSSLLGDNVDAATQTLGEEFVAGLINGGSSRGEAMYTAIQALASVSEDDAVWGAAAAQLNNKVQVATTFATTTDFSGLTLEELRSVTADVDSTDQSVTDKTVLIQAGILDAEEQTQRLTTGQDFLKGTSLADFFKANYFDNDNTFQSGDEISGGLGVDTLFAKLGNSAEFAINAETTSVEIAKFQAQAVVSDSADNEIAGDRPGTDGTINPDENGSVAVDAQDMDGTVEFWSVNSRADLVIEDVRNNSHETTLVMQDTDSGDVDYAVYFDDQHITAPDAEVKTSLYLEVLDLEGMADGEGPLANNPYVGVSISVGGVTYEIVGDDPITTTYQDLVDALNAALQAAGLTSVTASLGEEFNKYNSDDGNLYAGTTIILTNDGSEELEGLGWIVDGTLPPGSNVHTNITNQDPAETTYLTQVDIELDNVGRGSESGDFRAGNMSTGDSGSQGIQQFNVTVHDSSWITSLSTTNDDLEVVKVVNSTEMLDMNTNGDLRIGDNGDDDGYTGVQNVRVFDASAMTGNLTLEADIDDGVIAKYFDKEDTQNGYESDDIQFQYYGGAGDDVIALTVSQEAVSYDDFELTIETGAGDDEVILEVSGTAASNLDSNWDEDQADQGNIVIATGAGNDTVRALGDGQVTITTGAGNDVVYSDNSGLDTEAATWVFNADNTEITDIDGSGAGSDYFLYNATLTVTFSGGLTGAGVTAADADEFNNGFESSEISINVSDYLADITDVNQALKDAINNDATLSKLLVAEDGPNNSVIVTALVDGVYQAGDLSVVIDQGDLPTTIPNALQSAWEDFNGDSTIATIDDADLDAQLTSLDGAAAGYQVEDSSNVVTGTAVLATKGTTAAVAEVFTVTFSGDENGDDTTIAFDGVTVTLDSTNLVSAVANLNSAASIATEFAAQYNADAGANWTAVDNGDGTVTFTADTAGVVADVVNGDFVITENTADDVATAVAVNIDTQGTAATDNLVDGEASDEESADNTINVGSGNDVIVLSTNDATVGDDNDADATAVSEETIVFTGTDIGNNDILNFTLNEDILDFTAYLTDIVSASGSTESQQRVATTSNTDASAGIDMYNNEVVIINDFDSTDGGALTGSAIETWGNLTAAALKTALNSDATDAQDYGNISTATISDDTDLVGSTQNNIVMVQNDANDGEYKVFHVVSTGDATDTVSTVTLLGTVDFGETVDGTTLVA